MRNTENVMTLCKDCRKVIVVPAKYEDRNKKFTCEKCIIEAQQAMITSAFNQMNTLEKHIEAQQGEIERLKAENSKMRDCLEIKESEYQSTITKANLATKLALQYQADNNAMRECLEWIAPINDNAKSCLANLGGSSDAT